MTKQTFLYAVLAGLLFTSCAVSKSVRMQQNLLSGSWTLNHISYEDNDGIFTAVFFNDVRDTCFEGSDWFFQNNNNTGRYTITQSSLCRGGDRFFRWSVVDPEQSNTSQLQFKFIDEKLNDISSGFGYRLNIVTLNEQSMTLKSTASVEGEPITIVYEFTKK